MRYAVAAGGYLALTLDQVLRPVYDGSISPKSSNDAILVTFPSKPLLAPIRFWSLTLYDAEGLYQKQQMSTPWATSNLTMADGPFYVLIQSSDVVPPDDLTTNWIPSPAGGGAFLMNLRFYGADSALTDGTRAYLSTEAIKAVTG